MVTRSLFGTSHVRIMGVAFFECISANVTYLYVILPHLFRELDFLCILSGACMEACCCVGEKVQRCSCIAVTILLSICTQWKSCLRPGGAGVHVYGDQLFSFILEFH